MTQFNFGKMMDSIAETSGAFNISITSEKTKTWCTCIFLALASFIAFYIRLYSVFHYESVIHEYDPYFNYRATQQLVNEGFDKFMNWFDDRAWYPLGRYVGATVYPGMMMTSAFLYHAMNWFKISVELRNVCVFLGPLFSSMTTIVTYLLTKELKDSVSGLFAAGFIAIVPGYISRSVAGSYDYEAIAIFCMLLAYYFWIKAIKTGSLMWSTMCALAYFYMASSWGGYVVITNLIPLHVFFLMLMGRFSQRIYTAYTTTYVLGKFLSMQVPFIGLQPISTPEHLAGLGVFGLCQLLAFIDYIRSRLPNEQESRTVIRFVLVLTAGLALVSIVGMIYAGKINYFTGRLLSLLNPFRTKDSIPLIASVSEHQPTAWSGFFMNLHMLILACPVGIYFSFINLTNELVFVILYGILSLYFASMMIRLMLILAPAMCILAGIGLWALLKPHIGDLNKFHEQKSVTGSDQTKDLNETQKSVAANRGRNAKGGDQRRKVQDKKQTEEQPRIQVAWFLILAYTLLLISFTSHSFWLASSVYDKTSIVIPAGQYNVDDFREAYYWLRMNTGEDARIMSWWDYGYQISSMANRTVLVDNNTWNNDQIARVGQAMASTEDKAHEIMTELGANYVLAVCGGRLGYSSDDINKLLWMVRIGSSIDSGKHIEESDYYNSNGEYRVGEEGSPALLNSLMYKMCYHNFNVHGGHEPGLDKVRKAQISNDINLNVVEEVFTSLNWLVRIYRVKELPNRSR